jgi:hypothetical protein
MFFIFPKIIDFSLFQFPIPVPQPPLAALRHDGRPVSDVGPASRRLPPDRPPLPGLRTELTTDRVPPTTNFRQ